MKLTKKLLCFTLALALVFAVSCAKKSEKPTANEKAQNPIVDVMEKTTEPSENVEEPVVESPENVVTPDETHQDNKARISKSNADSIAASLGGFVSDGGEYKDYAETFAEAVADANLQIVSEFTGGFPQYYEFLRDVEFYGYTIYPMAYSQEKISAMDEAGQYFMGYDMYLIDFDVKKGDGEYFTEGNNLYFLSLGIEPLAGNIVNAFVKPEQAIEHIFYNSLSETDYRLYFIREFVSLYKKDLYDGKNYPESFDLSDAVHLVTHLMARSARYEDFPPYSIEEINDFVKSSFDAHEGIALENERDVETWMLGYASFADIQQDSDKIFGCSYGHGASIAEHSLVSMENDGENTVLYTVNVYADYAHFALAKQLVFTFEEAEGALSRLILLQQRHNTQRPVAYVSI